MQEFVIFVMKYLKGNMLKIKKFAKIGIVVIMEVNIEALHIAYLVLNIAQQKKFP